MRSLFQCSSASRKFLNRYACAPGVYPRAGFSALQRAENSSMAVGARAAARALKFQCSSASRKFLNGAPEHKPDDEQRHVSVLFSEPKIPQFSVDEYHRMRDSCFSALQRAENSSIHRLGAAERRVGGFSALQRAENSSICPYRSISSQWARFSALQRAENSSIGRTAGERRRICGFSALQRAENSSIIDRDCGEVVRIVRFSALQRAENSSINTVSVNLAAP